MKSLPFSAVIVGHWHQMEHLVIKSPAPIGGSLLSNSWSNSGKVG